MRTVVIIIRVVLLLVMGGAMYVIDTQEIPLERACFMLAIPFVLFAVSFIQRKRKTLPY
ncbi:MAG: hypothetical protein NT085_02425 [candidate division SR1 bacterium]|nr:hypothetical protein [candidate division SR1 bacterium]